MRAAKLTKKQKIDLCDIPKPEPGAGEVLVEIRAVGICGTDLHIYAGHRPDIQLPRVMGHEFAGVVAALGSGVSGVQVGDHVTVDPVVACGQCYACRRGRRNLCTGIMCLGCQTEGGFQDFVVGGGGGRSGAYWGPVLAGVVQPAGSGGPQDGPRPAADPPGGAEGGLGRRAPAELPALRSGSSAGAVRLLPMSLD